MIRAVLFDFGGTLDGGGGHWLDRFVSLYGEAGIERPREVIRQAFDAAERRANVDTRMLSADLDQMIDLHLRWQFNELGLDDERLRARLARSFVSPIYSAAPEHQRILTNLARRDFRLGVVSNGCGNADVLCAELGFSPYLSVIVDSRRVGVFKPDPAIFHKAASELKVESHLVLMVGDSFERDVRAAKKAGMQTAWLKHNPSLPCPDPSVVDLTISQLSDLTSALSDAGAAVR